MFAKRTCWRAALLALILLCLPPQPGAVAAPWLKSAPQLSDLDLTTWLTQGRQTGAETPAPVSEPPVYHPEPTPAANQSPAKDPEPTPTAQVQTATYTVCRGDTLWGIAQKNGVTVAELRRWNRLSGNLIHAGQVLKVGESKVVTHTVESGETLWSIATQYRTSVAALATSNGLSSRGTIFPGERLTIPGQAQSVSRGGLSYRLIWPVSGVVTSGWGYRTRFEKFHYGLDIAAQTGTPIKAVMSGVVEFAGWKSGYGYCVFLDHGNGVKTAYGHASKLYVKKGQTVTQGKTIAAVGSTGFSTGPHVHLEVRINGKLVNPTNYLP